MSAQKRQKSQAAVDNVDNNGSLHQETGLYTYRRGDSFQGHGFMSIQHFFEVPLDYTKPKGEHITVFAREVLKSPVNPEIKQCIVFLQGGPGFECFRISELSGWMASAGSTFRIILLDQRGTGLSSKITVGNLHKKGSPQQQADYLQYFRADNIINDAEVVRTQLLGNDKKWSIIGQSFGGFCSFTYLSFYPNSLTEAFTTGGIPPNAYESNSSDSVYRQTFKRCIAQNQKYYSRYPQDIEAVIKIVKYLMAHPNTQLPGSKSKLSPQLFQTIGMSCLGFSASFEKLHYLIEYAFDESGDLSYTFLKQFEESFAFDTNPLYALLHEPCYSNGGASNWSANKIKKQEFDTLFDARHSAEKGLPVYFTGEMIFPFQFEELTYLQPYKETADILMAKDDWTPIYNVKTLENNKVPIASAQYYEDMFVDFVLAQNTASNVRNLRQYITNEYLHSGLRDDGQKIFDKLISMTRNLSPII